MPPERYAELLKQEIRERAVDVPSRELSTIYFGGGTPSLFEPMIILSILDELAKTGFRRRDDIEMTIEIDPATVDQSRLDAYRRLGFNRFSVGAQTFNARLLKIAGRKHTAENTVELLNLLRENRVNYSFDLLFALPTQTLAELRADVATALTFAPSHLSAYCLTVPESHPMARDRAPDDEQAAMFDAIESDLKDHGVLRYEISNFAKPGFESRHNYLYWTDQAYWGLGAGAHSYFPREFAKSVEAPWGSRFWNPPTLNAYETAISGIRPKGPWRFLRDIERAHLERLERNQALTDFCHTSLRLARGLDTNALRLKFGEALCGRVEDRLTSLETSALVARTAAGWNLTARGRVLANLVFEKLTFLKDELNEE